MSAAPKSARDYTPDEPPRSFMEVLAPANPPKSELGVYRILAPSAGVRVSPLCLGIMSLGTQWAGMMGRAVSVDDCEKFLDYYYEAGGNFIDTANNYQDSQNQKILGEWMEKRGIRDQIVIGSKYTAFGLNTKEGKFPGIGINNAGNHKKNLKLTIEASLRDLRTTYIDLLYVHWWDYTTSIPELMRSLDDLVKSGKVLYLGISDAPAWVVATANTYANAHALTPFVVYQGNWAINKRDMEREIIPMCRANGMAVAPWGALGQGKFKTKQELESRKEGFRLGMPPSDSDIAISKVLQEVAEEIGGGVKLANVALAWTRHVVGDCFPIIGGSSIEHLKSNIEALKIEFTKEQLDKLTNAIPFDYGFPYDTFGTDPHQAVGNGLFSFVNGSAGQIKFRQTI